MKSLRSNKFSWKNFTKVDTLNSPKWYKNHYNDPFNRWIILLALMNFLLFYIVTTMRHKKLKIHFNKRHSSPLDFRNYINEWLSELRSNKAHKRCFRFLNFVIKGQSNMDPQNPHWRNEWKMKLKPRTLYKGIRP